MRIAVVLVIALALALAAAADAAKDAASAAPATDAPAAHEEAHEDHEGEHAHDHDHEHEGDEAHDEHDEKAEGHEDGAEDHGEPCVTVLGAGKVGAKIVELLAQHRIPVHVWNRNGPKALALVTKHLGVAAHADAAPAVGDCDVIITTLPSDEIDKQVLKLVGNKTEGKHWVQFTGNHKEPLPASVAFAEEHKLELVSVHACPLENFGDRNCEVVLTGTSDALQIVVDVIIAIGTPIANTENGHEEL